MSAVVPSLPHLKETEMNKLKSIFLTLTVSHKLDSAWSQLAWGPFTVGCLLPAYQSSWRMNTYRAVGVLSKKTNREKSFIKLCRYHSENSKIFESTFITQHLKMIPINNLKMSSTVEWLCFLHFK